MGKTKKDWRERTYGSQQALSLKSRIYVLLRDELGLGRQPKVAQLLVDEILAVVESTLVGTKQMKPGQVLVLAPKVGQGPSWRLKKLEEKQLKAVRLTLVDAAEIERLSAGERLSAVRLDRLVRMVKEAYEQGATLTSCQLAMMTGVAPGTVSAQLRRHMKETGETLPTRGIVEDCSPAVSHKVQIIERHLTGETTSEIAKGTNHTPHSVERYIKVFERVRELVGLLDREVDAAVLGRILNRSPRLVQAYLELLPPTPPAEEADGAV